MSEIDKGRDFLEKMATADESVEHRDDCGHCGRLIVDAQVARDLLAAGRLEGGMSLWVEESTRRWRETKYFLLYQQEQAAGRDPADAFAERGWEM